MSKMFEGACNWQAVARKCNVNFSTISRIQHNFREFDRMSKRPHNRCVGEGFADVSVVNRVPHDGGGVMAWAGISYGQRTQLHFIDGNFNAQR
jgi:hypothetical protein